MNRFGPHARRRWNIDYAWRYRQMAQWVQAWRPSGVMLTAQWFLDTQDEVVRDARYHALPLGVWRRRFGR